MNIYVTNYFWIFLFLNGCIRQDDNSSTVYIMVIFVN